MGPAGTIRAYRVVMWIVELSDEYGYGSQELVAPDAPDAPSSRLTPLRERGR
jgi:hypothetical protein